MSKDRQEGRSTLTRAGMMLRTLLGTNLCVRAIRDRPAGLRPRFNAEASGLCILDIVLFELLYGTGKSARPAKNRRDNVSRLISKPNTLHPWQSRDRMWPGARSAFLLGRTGR